jgi:hypothetical protein
VGAIIFSAPDGIQFVPDQAKSGGRDVRTNRNFMPSPGSLALAFVGVHATSQISSSAELDIKSSLAGSTLTCTQPPQLPTTFRVPPPFLEWARLKARLAFLLRESLYDDANGIVNIAREKEIKKLANKVRSGMN